MDFLKEQINNKLENLPETELEQVLEYVTFLEWRKSNNDELLYVASEQLVEEDKNWLEADLSNLGNYEPYEWQPGELNEGLPVKHLPGKGIVIVEE
ncbi:MAG: hypothetical protein WBA07_01760 [Rivularia sp. (in: cyanobacteria)]